MVSRNGKVAASAGFGGEVKFWTLSSESGEWGAYGELDAKGGRNDRHEGEVWALALSEDGAYLATTTYDGRINVWSLATPKGQKVQEYETGSGGAGSFGLCVDISRDGKWTASGHQNGSVYVFNNSTGKIQYSLPGMSFDALCRHVNNNTDFHRSRKTSSHGSLLPGWYATSSCRRC